MAGLIARCVQEDVEKRNRLLTRRLFNRCDIDGNGLITGEEFDELDIIVKSSAAYKTKRELQQNTSQWNKEVPPVGGHSGVGLGGQAA